MSDDDRYERGRARFLEVHDEKALASVEGLGDLGHVIVEVVYGDVYSRSELSTRLTPQELGEVIMQTAVIAGFPPAMNAMSTLRTIVAERDR